MRRRWLLGLGVLVCACKAEIAGFPTDANNGSDGTTADAAVDGPGSLPPWGAPQLVPGGNTAVPEDDGSLTADGLEMVFSYEDPSDASRKHLYYMRRPTAASSTWSAPLRLSVNVSLTTDQTPRFSADGLTLYFATNRSGTTGGLDIFQAKRPALGSTAFAGATPLAGVNSTAGDKWWVPCDGDRYLLISQRTPSTSEDIYEGTLGGGAPTRVDVLSSPSSETGAFLTKDCLTTYFASTRSGPRLIYTATRASPTAAWSAPTVVQDFMALGGDLEDPWLADDDRTFVLVSNVAGDKNIYLSTR